MNKLLLNALSGMSTAPLPTTAIRSNAADNPAENEHREYDNITSQTYNVRRKKHVDKHRHHNRRASDVSENGQHGRRIDDAPLQEHEIDKGTGH